jgi:DNA-binding XRE family transcriptional regulator
VTARADREFYIAFGQRLRIVREALGLTEQEAATASGLTLKSYRAHEAGLRPPFSRSRPSRRRAMTNVAARGFNPPVFPHAVYAKL